MKLSQFNETIAEKIAQYGKTYEGSYDKALELAHAITKMLETHIELEQSQRTIKFRKYKFDGQLTHITQKIYDKKIKEMEAKHDRLKNKLAGGKYRE